MTVLGLYRYSTWYSTCPMFPSTPSVSDGTERADTSDSALHKQSPHVDALQGLSWQLQPALATVAFWIAVGLPALYLPLLVAGVDTTSGLTVFLGLVCLHLMALLAGHTHRRR